MYRLLSDRVLIKMDKAPETTEAGLIVPGETDVKPTTGEIVAIGTDCTILEKALKGMGKCLDDAIGMRVQMDSPFFDPYEVDGESLRLGTDVDIAVIFA